MFLNRFDAGQQLAEAIKKLNIENGFVICIPRGGVVVGAIVAQQLKIPMDIIIPKKVGAPHNPEIAVGAVTQNGTVIYNRELLKRIGVTEEDLKPTVEHVVKEIKRRMISYRGTDEMPNLSNRHVIVIDDGIATGSTMLAALRSIKNYGCKKITLAIPVAPPDTLEKLKKEVDDLVCLISEEPFYAVSQFYKKFNQISDEEVISLLKGNHCCERLIP